MPEVKPSDIQTFASIKVVGVGGAGGSAVNRMKEAGLTGRSVYCYEYRCAGAAQFKG